MKLTFLAYCHNLSLRLKAAFNSSYWFLKKSALVFQNLYSFSFPTISQRPENYDKISLAVRWRIKFFSL